MRIKPLMAFICCVVAIIITSCNRNYIALDYTNAKGEVPQLGNLVFRFNKSLIADSLLNNWDSIEYVSFETKIPGRFRWEGTDQLVFSPSKPLLPATTYKATIHEDVLRYSKYDKVRDANKVSFHTAPLQLNDAQVTWVLQDESSRVAVPQLMLAFNYPVKPEDVKDKLKIEVEGTKVESAFQSASATNELLLRLNGFKGEDKDYEAKVFIDKGIKPDGGQDATNEPIQTLLSIP